MLDPLRRHAASWITKTILGIMSIGLVFYFGYAGLQNANQAGGGASSKTLAEVNGENIPLGLFEFNYENQIRFYEQMMKGNVSEMIRERVKQSTLDRLINTKLFAQEAKKMGVRISKEELISAITENPNFIKDGSFNKNAYLKQFKPIFFKETHTDYEDYLTELLLSEKFEDLTRNSVKTSDEEVKEEYKLNQTELNLQKYSINLDQFAKTETQTATESKPAPESQAATDLKAIEGEIFTALSESQPSSKDLKNKTPSAYENLKKKYEIKEENTGFYSLRNRAAFVGGIELPEALECIIKLEAENPWCPKAYKINEQIVFFKLLERKQADFSKFEEEKEKIKSDLLSRKQNLILKQVSESLVQKAQPKIYNDRM